MADTIVSNYDIIGIHEGATRQEIKAAFRKLALQHHSDRGGEDDQFRKIKQAYEELKIGKKYPDTEDELKKKSKVYSGDSDEEKQRRNLILSRDLAIEMRQAQEWTAALNRSNATGMRLFGSKELGEIEFERQANKTLFIRGKYWAGGFSYDGPIIMRGSITNPYFAKEKKLKTNIHVTKGNFSLLDPIANKYDIEHGATITVDDGDISVGSISGIKEILPDPDGKVGMSITIEHFTQLIAPKGKIVAGNVRETSMIDGDEVVVINLVDNIIVCGRKILVYGSKVNYDVVFELKQGGMIRFHDKGSGFDISNDAIIRLENGKEFRLVDLKTSKMISYGGQDITYEYLDKEGFNVSETVKDKKNRKGFSLGGLLGK